MTTKRPFYHLDSAGTPEGTNLQLYSLWQASQQWKSLQTELPKLSLGETLVLNCVNSQWYFSVGRL